MWVQLPPTLSEGGDYMHHKQMADDFFDERVRPKEARMKLLEQGVNIDDIDYTLLILHVRYRQLKAALRSRI